MDASFSFLLSADLKNVAPSSAVQLRVWTERERERERERVGRDNEALLCINEGTVSVQNWLRLHKLGARFSFHSLLAGAHFSPVSNQCRGNDSDICGVINIKICTDLAAEM